MNNLLIAMICGFVLCALSGALGVYVWVLLKQKKVLVDAVKKLADDAAIGVLCKTFHRGSVTQEEVMKNALRNQPTN